MEPRLTPPKPTFEDRIRNDYQEEYEKMNIEQLVLECELFGIDIHSEIVEKLVNYRMRKWEVR